MKRIGLIIFSVVMALSAIGSAVHIAVRAQAPLVPLVTEVHPDDVIQIVPHAIPRADSVFTTVGMLNAVTVDIPNNTVLGNVSGVAAPAVPLNQTQLTSLVNPFTVNLSGAVPAPGAVNNFFLRDDGTWVAVSGTGTVTSITIAATTPITATGTCTISTTGTCTIGVLQATATEWLSNTANRVLSPNAVWSAAAVSSLGTVTVGSITPSFCTHGNYTVTLGGVGLTLANPSCIQDGQTFSIYLVQDGTGSRTITTYGSYYKFAGGTAPTLTTTANHFDLLQCTTRAGGATGVCVPVLDPQ